MLKLLRIHSTFHRGYCKIPTLNYAIPLKYRNAFFLANAPLADYTHWFIHKAYEVCFPNLVHQLQGVEKSWDTNRAVAKVLDIIDWLEPCGSLIDMNFPVRRADGRNEVVRGFRAMHCLGLYDTPCLGGMRICSDLSKDHVKAFSVLSTFKHACMGIEMSGAHGGLKISGYEYDTNELKDIVVSYGKELAKRGFLGSRVDILEPDLYCSSQEMEWIAKEFANKEGNTRMLGFYTRDVEDNAAAACAVGKPRSAGGLETYDKSLAHGVLYALRLFMSDQKLMEKIEMTPGGLSEKKFIIQGLGKVGTQIILALTKAGASCVGVKEHDAYIYMEDGVPVEELLKYKKENGSIQEFNQCTKPSSADEIYTEPCDILIFAATHRSLQCYVAQNVQAKILVEAAHAPITPTAHKVLLVRKKLVLPDIFAGCGASITSYLEYVKTLQYAPCNVLMSRLSNLALTSTQTELIDVNNDAQIQKILEMMMLKSYEEIQAITQEHNLGLDIRSAAYVSAIRKIFRRIVETKRY